MTQDERQKLREAALAAVNATRAKTSKGHRAALAGSWELQTSNSWRRIGAHGDGDVLCPTTHHLDRHPDLTAPSDVLDYIIAAQPRVVLELLDQLDAAQRLLSRLAEVEARLDETDRKLRDAQIVVEELRRVTKGGTA